MGGSASNQTTTGRTAADTTVDSRKVIDLVDMNGKVLAGVKALTTRLERIDKALA